MDEILLKQLVRQLKIMNFWITFFGVLFLTTLIIAAVLIFKMVSYVHNAEQKISDIQTKTQSTLNLQKQLCDDKSISSYIPNYTSVCQ